MAKIIKKVTLNAPASTSTTSTSSGQTGVDPTKGTPANPFTEDEFFLLLDLNQWNGGYVEGHGLVLPIIIISSSGSPYGSFCWGEEISMSDSNNGTISHPYSWQDHTSNSNTGGSQTNFYYNETGTINYSFPAITEITIPQITNTLLSWYYCTDVAFIKSFVDLINYRQLNSAMNTPFTQALIHYNSGTGLPLTLNVNSLDLDELTWDLLLSCDLNKTNEKYSDTYVINLLDSRIITTFWNKMSSDRFMGFISTAITLGTITLEHISGNRYKIVSGTYDFNIEKDNARYVRNLLTGLGFVVNEGLSIVMDAFCSGLYGVGKIHVMPEAIAPLMGISVGAYRRHIAGKTSFTINITGTISIKN